MPKRSIALKAACEADFGTAYTGVTAETRVIACSADVRQHLRHLVQRFLESRLPRELDVLSVHRRQRACRV